MTPRNSTVHWINGKNLIFSLICLVRFANLYKFSVESAMKGNEEVLSSPANIETDILPIDLIQLSPPVSIPPSPAITPVIQVSSPNLPFNGNFTNDPNWQALRPTVRERNAAMFNNELMADIHFTVGSSG